MALLDIVVLALIQGVTEFLPISSSGHLILWPLLTGRPDQGVTMDVAVHAGTLAAVCLYFRRDLAGLFAGTLHLVTGRTGTPQSRLALLIALATVPAVIAGLALKVTGTDEALRSVAVIGWATLVGGVLLWVADRAPERRGGETWGLREALFMGLAQALALIPGTSRSGITMTAARALGFRREDAARLSLLMAIPVILAATLVETAGLVADGDFRVGTELLAGAFLSFLAALAALVVMMRMFRGTWTMTPFVVYRLGLGVALIAIAHG